ncbi:MAG: hypothetical protein KJ696_06490 [Gammaproteobacteria bacterium]|nr:hypothetical protein [Gammaproteobacteria bacterium]MBU1973704.1 hypothetical protein [Gammaproteobacteria bacterium]
MEREWQVVKQERKHSEGVFQRIEIKVIFILFCGSPQAGREHPTGGF